MHRRAFLISTGGAAAAAFAAPIRAANAATPRFLLVFLRGGYDAASLLVATSSAYYREVRPNIAVVGASALDANWGLHPALATSVLPLVQQRQACFIPFAGTDDLTRSHFETQDSIELGQGGAPGLHRDLNSGFLNRLVAQLAGREAIAFTDQLPLVLRGSREVANLSLKAEPHPSDARLRQALTAMYRGQPLQTNVDEAYAVRDEAARDVAGVAAGAGGAAAPMAGEMVAANRRAINARGFEIEARRIARVMRERYAIGFVDVGGWDTHVGQGAATGYLASRLDELGRGLAAYAEEIGPATWRHTVVYVVSEFGRTMRENGNRGTDHGHGSVHWVLGGGLAAGPVAGEQQAVEARTMFQNRDWPVLNDYRSVLGGLFARQFALDGSQLERVFPGAKPRDLGLI
ncbi:MAG: DUF1501 domain-containing protein [Burkholderiales bacterium]|nr:DUF1501 domain-containing protein [Burkholderiales bacterium]